MPDEILAARPQHVDPVALQHLADAVGAVAATGGPSLTDLGDATVSGVTLRTSAIRPGDLYCALPGARTHGARFAGAAVEAGAVALLTDPDGADECLATGRPVLVHRNPRGVLGPLARAVYADAVDAVSTVGVTGTQGKTTVTYLLESGLRGCGEPSAVVGTTGTRIDGVDVDSALTTPEATDLHALYAVMREREVGACALEVSSHALVQGRVDGLLFDVAVFLNLGRDHLDFHADIDDYFEAKASLFTPDRARRAVVDVDDAYGRQLLDRLRHDDVLPTTTLSARGADADYRAVDVVASPTGSRFTLLGPGGLRAPVRVPLPGAFNVSNALAAVVALVVSGRRVGPVLAGVGDTPGVPGRMEVVATGDDDRARVVVDYAHKPDALVAVLEALRAVTSGRLLVVIGAGGDRDPGKRPMMGEVAARLADVVVVTDDNPRSEEPQAIREQVLAGARAADDAAELLEVGERRDAIARALSLAGTGDCVLVAGKGHERGQEVRGTVHPFDDREVVRDLLSAADGGGPA